MTAFRRQACERGSAAPMVVMAIVGLLVGAGAALTAAGDLAATAARARTAADAAALAAAGGSPLVTPGDNDPRRSAAAVARANGATLTAVDPAAWPLGYAVTVEVEPSTRWVRRIVGAVRARAWAGVRPRRGPHPRGE